ncbi:GNAT family N-acetyltransferase [Undibacterium aquatile]
MLKSLDQKVVFINKRKEGFVVAQKESEHPATDLPLPAHIHFLYVQKEFEGRKIGSELMRCVISQFSLGTRINIVCEGQRRKSLFEKLGFQLLDNDNSSTTTFCMSINLVSLYQT